MDLTDLKSMQRLAVEVWRLRPELANVEATVGELAWSWGQVSGRGEGRAHRIWAEGGATVAWGLVEPPQVIRVSADRMEQSEAMLLWQTHPERPELLDEILDWYESKATSGRRGTTARVADAEAVDRLRARGYEHDPGAIWGLLNARDLDDIEPPSLPDGYRLLTMRELADVSRRSAAHRAAWEPSRVTGEVYAQVMRVPPYRDDLDFVVEAPDGTLVASAIGWYDEANRVGEFEPVGTHTAYRRRGIGRALMLFGLERFRKAGATRAIVGCRGDAEYPIPKRLYESVGFREITRELRFRKD